MADDLPSPADDYFVEPIKRASQACENCRRKKSRCSGEKPRCSLCSRLRQRCIYSLTGATPNRGVRGRGRKSRSPFAFAQRPSSEANRLNAVENRLCELAQALGARGIVSLRDGEGGPRRVDETSSLSSISPSSTLPRTTSELDIPDEIQEEGVLLYFRHFYNQPYPLLSEASDNPQVLRAEYPKLVLFPLLALSLRTCQNSFFHTREAVAETCEALAEAAWNLLTAQYSKFEFDLAYFQALCLLAQVDFATGKPHRAQAQVALGLRLAQTRGLLGKEDTELLEDRLSLGWRSVVWTLFMMDRIFTGAGVRSSCVPATSFQLFLPQCSAPHPEGSSGSRDITLPISRGGVLQTGAFDVVACSIALLDVWHTALMDVFDEGSSTPVPFWRNDSAQATIETRLMEVEMKAHPHRYTKVGSPRRVVDEPHLRPYFSAWVVLQILYSATRCLLHHPFVLFMKTRHRHNQVPLTTLQKSHQHSMIHSSWVIRHIIEMEGAGMSVYDPFMGYLVALAASIQLEHTINDNPKVANAARRKYDKAHAYLQRMAKIWPNMRNSLSVLDEISLRLHRRRTISYGDGEYDGAIPSEELSDVNVEQEDIDLMAKLFDYAALSSKQGMVVSSTTASSTPRDRPEASDSAVNFVPQTIAPASQDLAAMETRDINLEPLAVPEELDWPNGYFDTSADMTNDWSFLGQRWSTHFSE